jgi:hypothetical protein
LLYEKLFLGFRPREAARSALSRIQESEIMKRIASALTITLSLATPLTAQPPTGPDIEVPNKAEAATRPIQVAATTKGRIIDIVRANTIDRVGEPDYLSLYENRVILQGYELGIPPDTLRENLRWMEKSYSQAGREIASGRPEHVPRDIKDWWVAAGKLADTIPHKQLRTALKAAAKFVDLTDVILGTIDPLGATGFSRQFRGAVAATALDRDRQYIGELVDKYNLDRRFESYRKVVDEFLTPKWRVRLDATGADLVGRLPRVPALLKRNRAAAKAVVAAVGSKDAPPRRLTEEEKKQLAEAIAAEVSVAVRKELKPVLDSRTAKDADSAIRDARDSIRGLAVLASFVSPEHGRVVGKVGGAAIDVAESIHRFRLPDGTAGKIGKLALAANLLDAAGTIMSFFGPDANKLILEQLVELRKEVQQLRREMHERADHTDRLVMRVLNDMHDRFNALEGQLRSGFNRVEEKLDGVRQTQNWIAERLDDLEARGARRRADEKRNRFLQQIEPAFVELFTDEKLSASDRRVLLKLARTYGALADEAPDLDPRLSGPDRLGALCERAAEPGPMPVEVLAAVARELGVATVVAPDPERWSLASVAFLKIAGDWPAFTANARPALTHGLTEPGRALRTLAAGGVRPTLSEDDRSIWGAGWSENDRLFARLLHLYGRLAQGFEKLLLADRKRFEGKELAGYNVLARTPPASPRNAWLRVEAPRLFGRIGRADEVYGGSIDYGSGPSAKATRLGKDAALGLTAEEAVKFAQLYVPPAAIHAHRLGLGQLKIGFDVLRLKSWGSGKEVFGARILGLSVVLRVKDVNLPVARLNIIDPLKFILDPWEWTRRHIPHDKPMENHEIILPRWAEEVAGHPTLKALLLQGKASRRDTEAEQRAAVKALDALLDSHFQNARAGFEKQAALDLSGGGDIARAARRVGGAKALLAAYVRFAAPAALEDERFRAALLALFDIRGWRMEMDAGADLLELYPRLPTPSAAEGAAGREASRGARKSLRSPIPSASRGQFASGPERSLLENRFRAFLAEANRVGRAGSPRRPLFEVLLGELESLEARQAATR